MKFTLSWLKEYLDTDADLETIGETLTSLGLELEAIEDNASTFAPFKAAYVEETRPHPDADRLKICSVKTADHGVMEVVCGAPNARAGMMGVFAPEGATIPGTGDVLKKGVIRGIESCGMLVSHAEMGTSDDHDGIIELDNDIEIGTSFAEIFGLDDPVIEIDLTPNRGDCAGIRGIARDLAAKGLGELKNLDIPKIETKFACPVSITIDDTDACPHFAGRIIKGVKNGPSPQWMQRRLRAIGLRPISALVDITNYMTYAFARPLHVYDARKLEGNIRVGLAKGGEKLEALNDKSYELVPGAITINDDRGVIGLGGIVGGVSTGSEEDTTDVFLEAAYFDPARIARTGRDLQITSDARYRFERGVDPESTRAGLDIATQMILEVCGGEASEMTEAGAPVDWKKSVPFDAMRVKDLIGLDIHADEQRRILDKLGFEMHSKEVDVPSWRHDIWAADTDGRADIAEEIVRVHGFDDIPAKSVTSDRTVPAPAETLTLSRSRIARTALAARGLQECVTWSFMGRDTAALFGSNDNEALRLSNPISSDIDQMRPSILPNLITAARNNADRGYAGAALFETGPVFFGLKPEDQKIVVSGLRSGQRHSRHWDVSTRDVDLYDAKEDALAALEALGAPVANLQTRRQAREHFHPGRSGVFALGPNILAEFGELHPAVLDALNIDFPVAGFEIYLEALPQSKKKTTARPMLSLSPFQPVQRDFAFIVPENIEADEIVRAARSADKSLITDAEIFDHYAGKGIDDGYKSLALTVTIQPEEKTLTDEEIEQVSQKIIDAVAQKTGGQLRG